MPNDRAHFEEYRDQTRVKHAILSSYLSAYLEILKKTNEHLVYIDGFAGQGYYEDGESKIDGSPIRALKLISKSNELSEKVHVFFIEADDILRQRLTQQVALFTSNNHLKYSPECCEGTFSECLPSLIQVIDTFSAPSFLFVDPCGINGAKFESIGEVMKRTKCEAFIFFNIDGVRRTLGLNQFSRVLTELFGSLELAKSLYDRFRLQDQSIDKENLILQSYLNALRKDMGVKFIVPFRIEHALRKVTSHYLIHATNHHLGFRIMKNVMFREGKSEYGDGDLQFAQASQSYFFPLFNPTQDELKNTILSNLKRGAKRVSFFTVEKVSHPDDLNSESQYRNALIELEAEGLIIVLDKNCLNPFPANKRRKSNGKPTLGPDYYVQLSLLNN